MCLFVIIYPLHDNIINTFVDKSAFLTPYNACLYKSLCVIPVIQGKMPIV